MHHPKKQAIFTNLNARLVFRFSLLYSLKASQKHDILKLKLISFLTFLLLTQISQERSPFSFWQKFHLFLEICLHPGGFGQSGLGFVHHFRLSLSALCASPSFSNAGCAQNVICKFYTFLQTADTLGRGG